MTVSGNVDLEIPQFQGVVLSCIGFESNPKKNREVIS